MSSLFSEHWENSNKEIFRLALPVFTYSDSEMLRYKHYQKTGELIIDEEISNWQKMLDERREKGVLTIRLQIIKSPVPELTKFEIKEMQKYKYAEKSVFLNREELTQLAKGRPIYDFWLFDEKEALVPKYDKDGKWLGHETLSKEDRSWLVELKQKAMLIAKPLESLNL